ncbi:MAG: FAD-binding protein [Lentisphaeria bacterium]|nr:FAD-binding protein [Lentisphaeria bacterium]
MIIRVNQLTVPLDYTPAVLEAAVLKKLGLKAGQLERLTVIRRSIDARSPSAPPVYSLTAEAVYTGALRAGWAKTRDITISAPAPVSPPRPTPLAVRGGGLRPVVVGAGPAGLLAALTLARGGQRPILIDRGDAVETRAGAVDAFWRNGTLAAESNALFGEGGAGLFSDGKLTSRSKDRPRVKRFFDTLAAAGAPEEILIDAMPHVGSDRLLRLIPRLRRMIIEAGGEVRFNHRLDQLIIENKRLKGLVINGEDIACDICLLAIGHSARDTVTMLLSRGISLSPKAFAIGVRVEMPQISIDQSQWGCWWDHPALRAASFKLTRREESDARACYSFCMCPGGTVIACASSPGLLTTNGMSLHNRNKPFGNAAFLVPVTPTDFLVPGAGPLAGYAFQENLEKKAWVAGGGDFSLPASPLTDFLAGRAPAALPDERSCPRAVPADVAALLPQFATSTLRRFLPSMLGQLRHVDPTTVLLYGVETRSSSPVRIDREADFASPACAGLYPCGEGAGYAGGIVSSGIDGIKAAEAVLSKRGV